MFNVPITADCEHPTTLCLFAHAALPLHSPQARNVHHALGNCFFPPPLKSHHFTRLRASVLLFIFKGLNQDKYSQVNSHRRAALCGPQKWPENLLSRYKIVSVAQRSRKNVDGFERKGEESWWWDLLGSCPEWGFTAGITQLWSALLRFKGWEERLCEIIQ